MIVRLALLTRAGNTGLSIAGGLCILGLCFRRKPISDLTRFAYSQFASLVNAPVRASLSALHDFRSRPPIIAPTGSSAHPDSAARRRQADTLVYDFAASRGLTVYQVSPSDATAAEDSATLYYHPQDVSHQPKVTNLRRDHVLYMRDVDYYVDLNWWLSWGRPLLSYTMRLSDPASSCSDTTWTTRNDIVEQRFAGGVRFSHPIWNHKGCAYHVVQLSFGRAIVYSTEIMELGDGRILVLYMPWCHTRFWTHRLFTTVEPIERLRISRGGPCGYNLIVNWDPTGAFVSLSYPGGTKSYRLPHDSLTGLIDRCVKGGNTAAGQVQTWIGPYFGRDRTAPYSHNDPASLPEAVSLLLRVLADPPEMSQHTQMQAPGVRSDRHSYYYPKTHKVGTQPKPSMFAFCDQIIDCPVTAPCRDNDAADVSVDGRLLKLRQSQEPYGVLTANCMIEFIRFLVPEPGSCHPWTVDQVLEVQSRPSQLRAWYDVAPYVDTIRKTVARTFIKAESNNKCGDPRNITTLPAHHRVGLSAFSLPLAKHCYQYDWYAFGREPAALAERVHQLASGEDFLDVGDYSRFDGTTTYLHTTLVRACMRRLFDPRYHDEIDRFLEAEENCKAYTASNLMYYTGFTTLSGSPLTSARNTLSNAFVGYLSARIGGLTPEDSWRCLGLYGGDDSLDRPVVSRNKAQAAKLCRLSLKEDRRAQGSHVDFLGRIYVNPWHGPQSILQVRRRLAKFHLVPTSCNNTDVPLIEARRMLSLYVTDPNTPVVREMLACWSRRTPAETIRKAIDLAPSEIDSWLIRNEINAALTKVSTIDLGDTTTTLSGYPPPSYDAALPIVALELDLDVNVLRERLQNESDITWLRTAVVEELPPVTRPVVYRDELIGEKDEEIMPEASAGPNSNDGPFTLHDAPVALPATTKAEMERVLDATTSGAKASSVCDRCGQKHGDVCDACTRCNRRGHDLKDCKAINIYKHESVCDKCKRRGHVTRDCRARDANPSMTNKTRGFPKKTPAISARACRKPPTGSLEGLKENAKKRHAPTKKPPPKPKPPQPKRSRVPKQQQPGPAPSSATKSSRGQP